MKIAIGAIFRDEYEYVIEWLAWHQIAGFDTFYIADNASTDGTRALLEALADLEYINLLYQPALEKQVQILAYKRIMQQAIANVEAVMFIDADEFITHESMNNGDEAKLLKQLLSQKNVGMVGINWRTFGSSGQEFYNDKPVIERFTECSGKLESSTNSFLKSATRVSLSQYTGPHKSDVWPGFSRINVQGKEITDFIAFDEKGLSKPVENSGLTRCVTASPLRVNHYVIKSKQEFTEKKRKRGDAMIGINHDRGMRFFEIHNFKDDIFQFPEKKILDLKAKMSSINIELKRSSFCKTLTGIIDNSNEHGVQGWLVDEQGNSKNLRINIFVNGIFQGFTFCGFYRPDLKEKHISIDGLSGFRYFHTQPLKKGDIVEVKVHANRYTFAKRDKVTIE